MANKSPYILEVSNLRMHFPVRKGLFSHTTSVLKAVDGVSFNISPGETLGLVGESGCGKSTLGRCIVRLLEPTDGKIRLMGYDITHRSQWRMRGLRHHMQMVFQDPIDSLNPRMDVRHLLMEPMMIQGIGSRQMRRKRVEVLLDLVGLPQTASTKFPHEFSGGQRQRLGIARALATGPKLLILDEPVSSLDVSVQSQMINLLLTLQKELNLSYIFISHDLSVVKHVCDRVAVMYLGKIVEGGPANLVYHNPLHDYTRALVSSIPVPDPAERRRVPILPGDVPSPIDPPNCSAFGRRVNHPYLESTYGLDLTPVEIEPGHWVAPDPCAVSLQDLSKVGIDIFKS